MKFQVWVTKRFLSLLFALWVVNPFTYAQDNEVLSLERLRNAREIQTDSLWYHYKKLVETTPINNRAILESGKLILADGLLGFNLGSEADSIFLLIDSSALLSSKEKIDYIILKAKLLQKQGRKEQALSYLYQKIENATPLQLAEIYMQIASILRGSSDLENCTKFYRLAESEARKADDIGLQVRANMQLCKVFNGWVLVNLDSSVYYGEKALNIAIEEGNDYWQTHAAAMVAAPLIRKGNLEKGKSLSRTALANAEQHSLSKLSIYYLLINLGFIYQNQKKYDSAWYYQNEAQILRPTGIDHDRLKYAILKSKGKFEEALQALEIYRSRYDSAKDRRHQTKISNLQARFETQQKEQEVESLSQQSAIQQLQISQQRLTVYGLSTLIIVIVVIGYLLYQQRKQRDQQKRENLEQRLLRLQMNPHFIYNALASIQNFVLQKQPMEASKYLSRFSSLMRQILEHSRQEFISLEEEIETIENYIKIQQLRYPQVNYSIDVDPGIDLAETVVPPMFVQPFVENAFEHGLAEKKEDAHVGISFSKNSEKLLQVTITDNGKGFSADSKKDHKSLAIQIANERLNKYGRKLHRKLSVALSNLNQTGNQQKGTSVSLLMPYK